MKTEIYATAGMGGVPAPHMERERVRKATRDDVPRLARAMARAFYDDPVVGRWARSRVSVINRAFHRKQPSARLDSSKIDGESGDRH